MTPPWLPESVTQGLCSLLLVQRQVPVPLHLLRQHALAVLLLQALTLLWLPEGATQGQCLQHMHVPSHLLRQHARVMQQLLLSLLKPDQGSGQRYQVEVQH